FATFFARIYQNRLTHAMISKLRAYRKPLKGFARAKRICLCWGKLTPFVNSTKTKINKYGILWTWSRILSNSFSLPCFLNLNDGLSLPKKRLVRFFISIFLKLNRLDNCLMSPS